MMRAVLDKPLKKKYNRKNFGLRKGDTVKIMRGNFKKKEGKVLEINLRKLKILVDGIQTSKKDGTKVNVWLEPSNLKIKELNLDDKRRKQKLEKNVKAS